MLRERGGPGEEESGALFDPEKIVADFLQDVADAGDLVEYVKHPEGIQEDQDRYQKIVDGLLGQQLSVDVAGADTGGQIEAAEGVEEKDEEDEDQDEFEEDDIKMPQHPPGAHFVPIPDLGHEFAEFHRFSFRTIYFK